MIPIATAMTARATQPRLVSVAILLTGRKPTGGACADRIRASGPSGWIVAMRRSVEQGGAGRALGAGARAAGAGAGPRPRLPAGPRHGLGARPGAARRTSSASGRGCRARCRPTPSWRCSTRSSPGCCCRSWCSCWRWPPAASAPRGCSTATARARGPAGGGHRLRLERPGRRAAADRCTGRCSSGTPCCRGSSVAARRWRVEGRLPRAAAGAGPARLPERQRRAGHRGRGARGRGRARAGPRRRVLLVVAGNAPWLVAGLLHASSATSDSAAAEVFALHGEGSVPAPLAALTLGGIWNTAGAAGLAHRAPWAGWRWSRSSALAAHRRPPLVAAYAGAGPGRAAGLLGGRLGAGGADLGGAGGVRLGLGARRRRRRRPRRRPAAGALRPAAGGAGRRGRAGARRAGARGAGGPGGAGGRRGAAPGRAAAGPGPGGRRSGSSRPTTRRRTTRRGDLLERRARATCWCCRCPATGRRPGTTGTWCSTRSAAT